jgi:Rrf2 family protein
MLTKSTQYALRSLVFVQLRNWDGFRPGVAEIAKEIDAPVAFTAKILHTLARHGLLESAKGRGGGFFFSHNQSDLSIFKVIHVMEGDRWSVQCGFGLKSCNSDTPCPLHDGYEQLRSRFLDLVQGESIRSLSQKILEGKAVLFHI